MEMYINHGQPKNHLRINLEHFGYIKKRTEAVWEAFTHFYVSLQCFDVDAPLNLLWHTMCGVTFKMGSCRLHSQMIMLILMRQMNFIKDKLENGNSYQRASPTLINHNRKWESLKDKVTLYPFS